MFTEWFVRSDRCEMISLGVISCFNGVWCVGVFIICVFSGTSNCVRAGRCTIAGRSVRYIDVLSVDTPRLSGCKRAQN